MKISPPLCISAVWGQGLGSWRVDWAAHLWRGLPVKECMIAGVGERSGGRLGGDPRSPARFILLLAMARGGRGMIGWRRRWQRGVEAHQSLQVSEHALHSWCTVDPATTWLARGQDGTLISKTLLWKEFVRILKHSTVTVRAMFVLDMLQKWDLIDCLVCWGGFDSFQVIQIRFTGHLMVRIKRSRQFKSSGNF